MGHKKFSGIKIIFYQKIYGTRQFDEISILNLNFQT